MPTQEEVPGFRSVAIPGELAGEIGRVTATVARAIEDPVERAALVRRPQPGARPASLDFSIHVSVRYHARRRAWYDRLHRLTMLVIAAGASAAVAAIIGGLLRGAEYLCAAVAVAGALELAYSLPERARNEDALYRRFNALAAEIAEAGDAGEERLQAWEARRLLIRADADDRLEVLRRICHNLEAEARGYPAEARYALWPWQRLLAQLISLPPLRALSAGP